MSEKKDSRFPRSDDKSVEEKKILRQETEQKLEDVEADFKANPEYPVPLEEFEPVQDDYFRLPDLAEIGSEQVSPPVPAYGSAPLPLGAGRLIFVLGLALLGLIILSLIIFGFYYFLLAQ